MSKSVMISIRPKWCEKIVNGEKTVEVRKTRPKMKTPFRCYIYCTLPKYPHEDYITTEHPLPQYYGGGKVIGEFVCDRIDALARIGYMGSGEMPRYNIMDADARIRPAKELFQRACLTEGEAEDYLKYRYGFGWHISGLKIYDTPKALSKFSRPFENCIDKVCDEFGCASCENGGYIKRPPQSWCYVEAMEDV